MPLSDNLISYYSCDEASGNLLDSHGSNDLTETSGTIGATTGKISGARDLELGDSEYFEAASNAELQTGDIDFSFLIWVNPESFSDFAVVAGKGNSEWYLNFSSGADNAKPRFVIKNSGGGTAQWGSSLSSATWAMLAGGYSATANEVWISVNAGTPVTTSDPTGPTADATRFTIGEYPPLAGIYFDGLIDEAGFWKRDIRADLAELYNGGSGRDYAYITGGGASFTLTADAGSVILTGTAASLLYGRKLSAAAGSITLTGTAANLLRGLKLLAGSGGLALTGTAAGLLKGSVISAGSGSFVVTGTAADLRRGFGIVADPGGFTISGQAASLLATRLLAAGVGSVTITGTDATLTVQAGMSVGSEPVLVVRRAPGFSSVRLYE